MPAKKSTVVEVVGLKATTYAAVGEVVVLARTPRVQALIDGGFLAETHPAFSYRAPENLQNVSESEATAGAVAEDESGSSS